MKISPLQLRDVPRGLVLPDPYLFVAEGHNIRLGNWECSIFVKLIALR